MAIHNQKHINDESNKKEMHIPEMHIKKETEDKPMVPAQENHFRAINLSQMSPENKVSGMFDSTVFPFCARFLVTDLFCTPLFYFTCTHFSVFFC